MAGLGVNGEEDTRDLGVDHALNATATRISSSLSPALER